MIYEGIWKVRVEVLELCHDENKIYNIGKKIFLTK